MLPIAQLLRFKGSSISPRSHSLLVDFHQIHLRNIFLFCFGLSMARQLFGDNINCHLDGSSIGQSFVDMKCFINGTHTKLVGSQYATLPVLYHDYYQWVPIVFLLMALSFYLPFRIWSRHVHNFMEELTTNIQDKEACDRILHVITSSKGNNLYWKTWALEVFYGLYLLMHIALLNPFFHGILSLSGWSWSTIPLLFPEMPKCYFDYMSGGLKTTGKFQCLMPLNTLYQKIFYVLYFLFCSLIVQHVLCFVYRIVFALRTGNSWINMWWCLQISKQAAKTWEAHDRLNKSWNTLWRMHKVEVKDAERKLQESLV